MKIIYGRVCTTVLFEKEWVHFTDAEKIYKDLIALISRHPSHLILDLQKVRFIDCRTVGILVQITLQVRNEGYTVTIRHLGTNVRLLIDTLQLDTIFDL